jgi:hypothetical protein
VVVLGFNSSDDPAMAREFMEENDFGFRTVLDSSTAATHAAYTGYKATCVPLHYVIDREGKIALTQPGFEKGYRKILGTLARLGVETGVDPLPAPKPVKPARKARPGEKVIASVGSPVRGTAVIRGKVVDLSGKPVGKAMIRLRCAKPAVLKAADSDETGCFVFRRLPAGDYQLSLERNPLDESRDVGKNVSLGDGQKVEVEFVFDKVSDGEK